MKNLPRQSTLVKVLSRAASQIGATITTDPEWQIAGQITFKNGQKKYFRNTSFDLNPQGAAEIAKDKDYAAHFIQQQGYPVIPNSKAFFSPEWGKTIGVTDRGIDAAYQHALQIGFPVIVKPNSGSMGMGVTLAHTKEQLYAAIEKIFTFDRLVLVQQAVSGLDIRIVVLDGEVISAYQRLPLNVIGDGQHTITELLRRKQQFFESKSRKTQIVIDDPRITHKLASQGLTLDSKPTPNQQIFLLDNANLSTGGDAFDITSHLHPQFKQQAIQLTKDMGLRLCGIDLMVDGRLDQPLQNWWVIEINSAPGLDHYAKHGAHQQQLVQELYLKVLKQLEKDSLRDS